MIVVAGLARVGRLADPLQAVGINERGHTGTNISSTRGNIMKLSRRDMFKIGGLAAVTAAGLAIPLGNTVSGATASLLPAGKMPKPFQTTFSRLEVLPPVKTEVDEMGPVAYYDITAKTGAV